MKRVSNEIDGVATECLNLLIVYFSYRQTMVKFNPNKGTRLDLHRWLIQLRVFENDMILRLCRLDDEDKTNHSLREALRSVRNDISANDAAAIDKQLKHYRQLINPLKTKARNYYLAHMSKAAVAPSDPKGNLAKPMEEVVNIINAIAGEPMQYFLQMGAHAPRLDLIAELAAKGSSNESS